MSKNAKTASGAEPDERHSDSVLDFFYHDPRRIGSFLSQFDDYGHLQNITHSELAIKKSGRGFQFGVGGGLAEVANGSLSVEVSPKEGGSESSARLYDPIWANALDFLGHIQARNLIHDDIATAHIGQFVKASGSMIVLDTGFLQRLLQQPSIRKQSLARKEINPHTGKPFSKEELDAECDAIGEVSPHVQMHLSSNEAVVWGTLRPEGLVTPPSELTMKNGIVVDGDWSIIGIKDADPITGIDDISSQLKKLQEKFKDYKFLLASIETNVRVRFMLGRPHYCYGITPLVVFRKVAI